jgi:hypothetical protein
MPYTHKSLAFVWLIALGLLALSASGVVAGPWLLLLLAVALATPALVLRSPAGTTTTAGERAWPATDERSRSPLDLGGIDVWENEGGARRRHVSGGIREPPMLPRHDDCRNPP